MVGRGSGGPGVTPTHRHAARLRDFRGATQIEPRAGDAHHAFLLTRRACAGALRTGHLTWATHGCSAGARPNNGEATSLSCGRGPATVTQHHCTFRHRAASEAQARGLGARHGNRRPRALLRLGAKAKR